MAILTLQPAIKDTELNSINDINFGSSTTLFVRSVNIARAILEFDISALPAGASIVSALLSLCVYETDAEGRTYWAYKLTRTNWVELQASWSKYSTGNDWTTAGGDYVTSSPAGGSDVVPAAGSWIDFDVAAIVQDAYDASVAAEFLIRDGNEGGLNKYTLFYSRDYVTDLTLRPKLVITYSTGFIPKVFII